MYLKSLNGCKLSISNYPTFYYNAIGGGGKGKIIKKLEDGLLSISFDNNNFNIPNLNWRTTKLAGIPMMPGLEIIINPEQLDGKINPNNGLFFLDFKARFTFTIGGILKAPDLIVETVLSTRDLQTKEYNIKGMNLQKNGTVILVGIATIKPTGNIILDKFLKLPNKALAELHCELSGLNK